MVYQATSWEPVMAALFSALALKLAAIVLHPAVNQLDCLGQAAQTSANLSAASLFLLISLACWLHTLAQPQQS